jgi:histidyl-tRNA synthetase
MGSVAAGGRYDNLIGIFDPKGRSIPAVGFSIGVERVFSILEARAKQNPLSIRTNVVDVYVCSIGDHMLKERMRLCTELWKHKIKAEFSYKRNPRLVSQFEYCERNQIPLAVIIGEEELTQGTVKIKQIQDRDDKGQTIDRSKLITEIYRFLSPRH